MDLLNEIVCQSNHVYATVILPDDDDDDDGEIKDAKVLAANKMIIDRLRGVYPYLPLATNAPRTIFGEGNFIKSLTNFSTQNPYNNCCQMSLSLSEYTKIYVGWGFAPDPNGGAYSAPQTL